MTIPIKQRILAKINRIAETQFFLRPLLIKSLENQILTSSAKSQMGNFSNYLDYWEATFDRQFFDMAVFIRFGTVIENCLKDYYMVRKEYNSLIDLQKDRKYKQNIFQRIQPWNDKNNNALDLYKTVLRIDLTQNPHLKSLQEAMLYRHLYAHNSGLVDEKYIQQLINLTGVDIRNHPKRGYWIGCIPIHV